jgi:hypothetical protein
MVNYEKGKIYKIQSHLGPKIYIGSTTKEYLSQRMTQHRSGYSGWKNGNGECKIRSYELFDDYGVENCEIILIEMCPCTSKDELTSKESQYIRTLVCVNKQIPNRTGKQYREENNEKEKARHKKYRQEHSEEGAEYQKQYKQKHRARISERDKKYREEHKAELAETKKKYDDENKEKKKEKFSCECGGHCRIADKQRHFKSKLHINFIISKSENVL